MNGSSSLDVYSKNGRQCIKLGTVKISDVRQIVLGRISHKEYNLLGKKYGLPVEWIGRNTRNPFRGFTSYTFGGYDESISSVLTVIEWIPRVCVPLIEEEPNVLDEVREVADGMHSEPICTIHVNTEQSTLEVYR